MTTETGMHMLHSGRVVDGVTMLPTAMDIVQGLANLHRYGGQTASRWTVLDHSILVAALVGRSKYGSESHVWAHALLHDWHECLTGDIPTPFKTSDMQELQQQLDEAMFTRIGLQELTEEEGLYLKALDHNVLIMERMFVHPNAMLEVEDVLSLELIDWLRDNSDLVPTISAISTQTKADVFHEELLKLGVEQ